MDEQQSQHPCGNMRENCSYWRRFRLKGPNDQSQAHPQKPHARLTSPNSGITPKKGRMSVQMKKKDFKKNSRVCVLCVCLFVCVCVCFWVIDL